MPSIEDLLFLLRGGAITPQDALGTYQAQEQARRERRIDRKQAMAEADSSALDSLSSTALKAAGEPTDLQGVMRAFGAEQLFASGDPESALDKLFLPTGQTNFPGNAGQSRINPTLDPEDAGDIAVLKSQGKTFEQIVQKFGQIYGPKTLERLMPEIQKVYSSAGS